MRGRSQPIVFDAVVLANFAYADRLDLIAGLYRGRGLVVSEVLDEIAAGIVAGYEKLLDIRPIVGLGKIQEITLNRGERQRYTHLRRNLGSGEASCIAAAEARNASVCTDDRLARAECSRLGIPFTGTIGVLKTACDRRILTPAEADKILSRMIDAGFYSPIKVITEIL